MLNNISLGRFYDTGSVLHRTDPRVKIILYMVFLIAIFMIKTGPSLALFGIVTVVQIIVAKIPLKVIRTTVVPVLPLIIFIFLLNVFTLTTGNVLWEWKFIRITDYGVSRAALMACRLLFLIISTSILLTLTTTPLKISDALESLCSPLKLIKIPVHEMAMMMSIALRFIPTLISETNKIMNAQVSRGADYDTGSVIRRVKGYITVLIPLFVSSFKRAEELAIAMDARCYRGGTGRTKLNPLRITGRDIAVGVIFTAVAVIPVVLEYILR
ncbi:energy-coupling factor transport system permease protein [Ruminococcaceae bacterium YRB3002]|nr:energy-coupling factor transport system permease protein [Ruminococcaceae bacterium YRB3002]